MATSMTLIASVNIGAGGSSTLSFTSIPQTYTDLLFIFSTRTAQNGTNSDTRVTLNGTNTGINCKGIDQRTAGPYSWSYSNAWYGISASNGSTSTANTFSNCQVYLPNYTNTTANKSGSFDFVRESNDANGGSAYDGFRAGIYTSNSAITSVGVENDGNNNYLQYTTAYLYGIKNS